MVTNSEEYHKSYYERNKEKLQKEGREYHWRNREKQNQASRVYYEANKERMKLQRRAAYLLRGRKAKRGRRNLLPPAVAARPPSPIPVQPEPPLWIPTIEDFTLTFD